MNVNRLWIIGSALVMILVIGGTIALGILPQLAATEKAESDRQAVLAQNQLLSADLEELKVQFENLDEIQDELDELRVIIPDDVNSKELLVDLNNLSKKSKVKMTDLTISDPLAFVPSLELSEDLPAGLDAANFYTIAVEIKVEAKSWQRVFDFLGVIQDNPRYFLVGGSEMTAEEDDMTSLTVSGTMFFLRNSDGTLDVVDPEDVPAPLPVPSNTATPGPTPSPTETPAP
jgi:hypothetical protein